MIVPAETEPRTVPEFSHRAHTGVRLADGTEVGCSSCHQVQADFEIALRPAAADCSACHDHADRRPPERAPSNGGVSEAEVAACSLCHVGGIPSGGAAVRVATIRAVDLVGDVGQFHPPGEDCAGCHLPNTRRAAGFVVAGGASPDPQEPDSAPRRSRVFASRTFYTPPAGTRPKPAIHRNETRKQPTHVDCFHCHWTRGLADSVDAGSATADPERETIRRRSGDDLTHYPGGPEPVPLD